MTRINETAFNTDRKILLSTLAKAKDALISDYFVVIMTNKERKELELYAENTEARNDLYNQLQRIAKDAWEMPWTDGKPTFCDKNSDNWLGAKLLKFLNASHLLIHPFVIEEYDFGYGCWLWTNPKVLGQEDIVKANLIMDQIGLAIKSFLNKKTARERGDKLAALLELSTSIYSSLNYTEVLQKAIKLAKLKAIVIDKINRRSPNPK